MMCNHGTFDHHMLLLLFVTTMVCCHYWFLSLLFVANTTLEYLKHNQQRKRVTTVCFLPLLFVSTTIGFHYCFLATLLFCCHWSATEHLKCNRHGGKCQSGRISYSNKADGQPRIFRLLRHNITSIL